MATAWSPETVLREEGGYFQILVTPVGQKTTDVTFFRDKPTILRSFSSGDPFGDAACQITFPQITSLDAFGAGDLEWLVDYADVDIIWVAPPGADEPDQPVWEGLIASIEIEAGESEQVVTLTCVGALYQLDFYVRAPGFLADLVPNELIIKNQFSDGSRQHLRVREMVTLYPSGWTTKNAKGENATGHLTRSSGSWDRPLTGFIQNLLAVMQAPDGRQWTLTKFTDRLPCLLLRDTTTVFWTIFAGAPGVTMNLTRDLTQAVNCIYAEGVDHVGTTWRNSRILDDGSATFYDPLAADPRVHPESLSNPFWTRDVVRVESFFKFDQMSQADAAVAAQKIIHREKDPGLFGTITLKIDPVEGTRYVMKAGENIRVKYLFGSGDKGIVFHIASCEVDVEDQTVTLTVDTKARDLLTLEEVIVRNRDGKTPSRMLQANRESGMIQDQKAPWDYSGGSGYIPRGATGLWVDMPVGLSFPYESHTRANPPSSNPNFYLKCEANAAKRIDRWAEAMVITSQADSIRLFEIAAYDAAGNVLAVPFHVSFYKYNPAHGDAYPKDASGPSPFLADAFKATASALLQPDPSMIIGWGDGDQKAGYSPGLQSENDPVTGMLRDEGIWSFSQDENAITRNAIYIAVYCEHTSPVYFTGRLYKGVDTSS